MPQKTNKNIPNLENRMRNKNTVFLRVLSIRGDRFLYTRKSIMELAAVK
jgi:hypothetical protein